MLCQVQNNRPYTCINYSVVRPKSYFQQIFSHTETSARHNKINESSMGSSLTSSFSKEQPSPLHDCVIFEGLFSPVTITEQIIRSLTISWIKSMVKRRLTSHNCWTFSLTNLCSMFKLKMSKNKLNKLALNLVCGIKTYSSKVAMLHSRT